MLKRDKSSRFTLRPYIMYVINGARELKAEF